MEQQTRALTHDEKKAAEAAFRGLPFNSIWSEAARKVYLGISAAMANKRHEAFEELTVTQPTKVTKRISTENTSRTRAKSTLW